MQRIYALLLAMTMSVGNAAYAAGGINTADLSETAIETPTEAADITVNDTGEVEIGIEGVLLEKDVDYTISYKNNIDVGEAMIVFTFIGNYAGVKEQTFNIIPKPTSRPSSGGGGGGGSTVRTTPTPKPTNEPENTENNSIDIKNTNQFDDVTKNDWYYDEVSYTANHSLFNGITDNLFAPNTALTRGMLVTVMYRLDGEPISEIKHTFTDITADAYYAPAVAWAQANGIVEGYDDVIFAPDDNITREQMAAIMYRYARYKGIDTKLSSGGLSYADSNGISDYARMPILWLTTKGLLNGYDDNTIRPLNSITRAETAAILQRYMINIAGYVEENKKVADDDASEIVTDDMENAISAVITEAEKSAE